MAPAPDSQGPGANSVSNLLRSAPAPDQKKRLQAAPAPYTKIFHLKLSKSSLLKQVYFVTYLPFLNALNVMFDTRTRLFFFAYLKDAALKNVAPAPVSNQQQNRLQSRP